MNRQISEKQTLFKIVRIFVAQYVSHIHNYKQVQSEALNILTFYVLKLIKRLAVQIKQILLMQGRTQPNCLHLLVGVKQLQLFDFQKLSAFMTEKRNYSVNFPQAFLQNLISKIYETQIETINNYEKDKKFANLRILKTPYSFKFQDQSEVLPFKCGIDQGFPKPAQFTYRKTVQKVERQKKNIQNLTAFTRRQNRKALGLYLQNMESQKYGRKIFISNQNEAKHVPNKAKQEGQKKAQFNFIKFL